MFTLFLFRVCVGKPRLSKIISKLPITLAVHFFLFISDFLSKGEGETIHLNETIVKSSCYRGDRRGEKRYVFVTVMRKSRLGVYCIYTFHRVRSALSFEKKNTEWKTQHKTIMERFC